MQVHVYLALTYVLIHQQVARLALQYTWTWLTFRQAMLLPLLMLSFFAAYDHPVT